MGSQGRYWMLTIPEADYVPILHESCNYIKGQAEIGESGYRHWQLVAYFPRKVRLAKVKEVFGATAHAEVTRSDAALQYVWKDDTAIPDTRFEYGRLPMKRAIPKDWDNIWDHAKTGQIEAIPADVRIRTYSTLKRICKDYQNAPFRPETSCQVFWGPTGTGKSHRMFTESYLDGHVPYVKSSTTKWWDGYQGQVRVIMDEFRGQIAVEHMLKWLDQYPCYVEEKGGQLALFATKFWICSNLHPDEWYPDIDVVTRDALKRRLNVTLISERDLSSQDREGSMTSLIRSITY